MRAHHHHVLFRETGGDEAPLHGFGRRHDVLRQVGGRAKRDELGVDLLGKLLIVGLLRAGRRLERGSGQGFGATHTG